jgi:hypothetical protein
MTIQKPKLTRISSFFRERVMTVILIFRAKCRSISGGNELYAADCPIFAGSWKAMHKKEIHTFAFLTKGGGHAVSR